MQSIIFLVTASALMLVGCSTTTTQIAKDLPVYCIRSATFLDTDAINGKVLLDMPGYPYGMDDEPMEVSRDTYNNLDVEVCASNDPRMQ